MTKKRGKIPGINTAKKDDDIFLLKRSQSPSPAMVAVSGVGWSGTERLHQPMGTRKEEGN